MMASFVILLIARTATIECADRHTYRHTHKTTTVTLAAHTRRGLISTWQEELGNETKVLVLNNKPRLVVIDLGCITLDTSGS